MSASASWVDRLDVHRPQPSSWLIRQTHRGLLVFLLIVIYGPAVAADIPALVRKAKPAVVQILCYDQDDELAATGTGFFISPDGKLLTNYHVIADAEDVVADSGAERYVLKSVLVVDKDRDVAELQFFVRPGPPVAYLTLGISADAVEGERVLVIGNPKGLEGTVSDGIISAFRKEGAIIQITAPISPGSSGSPLIDPESGKVIGMAKAIADDGQNLNFAISADAIRDAITKAKPAEQPPGPKVQKAIDRTIDEGHPTWTVPASEESFWVKYSVGLFCLVSLVFGLTIWAYVRLRSL